MDRKDNIEELFSEKFSDFSPEVDPSAWSNIQSSINSGAGSAGTTGSAGTGILGSKVAIISAVAVVSTVAGILIGSQFMGDSSEETSTTEETVVEQNDRENVSERASTGGIQELKNEIIEREEKVQEQSNEETGPSEPTRSMFVIDEKGEDDRREDSEVRSQSGSAAMDLANSSNYDPASDNGNAQREETNETNASENEEVEILEVEEDQPYVSIVASPIGGYAPLHVSFKSDANYDEVFWDFDDGTTSRESNPAHVFYEIGTYEVTVRVTSPEGQTATDKVFIEVKKSSSIEIPNVFTPNNDAVNDRFIIVGKKIRDFNMKIFDRQGKLLFETNDMNSGWDGKTLDGQDAKEDTYFYIINAEGEDGKQFKEKGSISLFR